MREKKKGWWDTEIIDIKPNKIIISGYHIQDLMGRVSYGEMAYLMIMGKLPSKTAAMLIDAVLISACTQGVISPAVTASCMAVTCGTTLSSAIATGMNMVGKIHGGATEDVMEVFYDIADRAKVEEKSVKEIALNVCKEYIAINKFMPGYGHRLHKKEDPRTTRLWKLAEIAIKKREISGKYIKVAQAIYEAMMEITGKHLTINIDASFATILCELGIPPQTASGFMCLSMGLGFLAHAYEQIKFGKRIKGPMPPDLLSEHMSYSGPEPRELPTERRELP